MELFDALGRWEEVLGTRRYLCGARITEADWCLFPTLVRFDAVYHNHFKCNLRRVVPKGPVLDLTEPHDRDRLSG